jgi:hypothetical protein
MKSNVELSRYSISGSRIKPEAFTIRSVSHPDAMIGFYVQTDLRKTCALDSCHALLIHNVNGSTGQEVAVVLPHRHTIPEAV